MRWRISTGLNQPTAGREGEKSEDAINGVGRRKVVAGTNRVDLDAIPAAVTPADAHPNVLAGQLPRRLPARRPPVLIALRPPQRLSFRKPAEAGRAR